MALFGSPIDKVRSMVADAIRGLGGDPDLAKTAPDVWIVGKGSASVVVRLVVQDTKGSKAFLQVGSPVMRLPPAPQFHERLSAFNFEMGGLATFAVSPAGEVQLASARTIEGITSGEIAQLVAQVAHFSDLYDDKLLKEFGREYALSGKQR